jgi:CDP-diacylglycerol--glycerol-3-phosphate 3-phosphatidyltransferase
MRAKESAKPARPTLTDLLRIWFKGLLDPVAAFLNRLGLAPNTLTLMGLAGNIVGAIFLSQGQFLVGGLIVLLMGPIDALDGPMARLRGEPSEFGAFVDSVTDRYNELTVLAGLLLYFLAQADVMTSGLIFAAAAGSVLVSYMRARGEALGFQVKGGILTRVERYLVLVPSLLLGFPSIGIAIIAVLANLTALQRVFLVRRQAYARRSGKE